MKSCRVCGKDFEQVRPLQFAFSSKCALRYVQTQKAAGRKADRARYEALKPLRQLLKEAQAVFNAYIRERDRDRPCISCGRMHQGAWDAGHYLSTGARSELRFDEANVHRQCVPCNQHLSGNAIAYRRGLIERIGLAEVERLEGPAPVRKWTRDDLAEIKRTYSAKRRALANEGER
jgi:hypothetical protein